MKRKKRIENAIRTYLEGLLMQAAEGGLLTPAQVAEVLGVHLVTVYRWLEREELVGLKLGRQWRIPVDELVDFAVSKDRRGGE